jgi:hypothetical protein
MNEMCVGSAGGMIQQKCTEKSLSVSHCPSQIKMNWPGIVPGHSWCTNGYISIFTHNHPS